MTLLNKNGTVCPKKCQYASYSNKRTREILTIHNSLEIELSAHIIAVVGTNKIHNFEKLL